MTEDCLPHLWLRDTWKVRPELRVDLYRDGEVQRSFWCHHLDVELVKPVLLFRVLEASGLVMLDVQLSTWTVETSTGWRFDGFEKLDDPKESRCE